jgi:hypothetical protein
MVEKTSQRREGFALYLRTMGVRSFIYLASALGLASCTLEEPKVSVVEQGLGCDPDFCMTNSPLISVYGTWEFKLDGTENDQGFAVIGLGKDTGLGWTVFYKLLVQNSEIFGLDSYGNKVLAGPDLVGAKIYLEHYGKRQHVIDISNVGRVNEIAYPNASLETYVLDWSDVLGQPLNHPMAADETLETSSAPFTSAPNPVCPAPKWTEESYVGSMFEWDETFAVGMSVYESLVFEGDRFDPAKRVVQQKPDNNWFNIGCGAYTLAKLRLSRNTVKLAPWWNVQAAFKNLSADYCGTGKAFTFSGEPLVWRDRRGMEYVNLNPWKNELEARWDENGARCINSPRLARSGNPDAAATYPDIWKAIQAECYAAGKPVRKCKSTDQYFWESSYELVTSVNYD